jgi:histidinol phosphatase-like PHP family hydrolase
MIDLHTHTFLSDGVLLPAEMVRRCQVQGYRALAITDHVGPSNLGFVLERIVEFCEAAQGSYGEMQLLPGCELTHVPPRMIPGMVLQARELGAEIVIVHGETVVEPVAPGTNRAAIEASCDVLAHPGMLAAEDAALAAELGVMLEISGRKGHSLTNGHVARLAAERGAGVTFGSDGHAPGDYPTRDFATTVLRGAGLSDERIGQAFANAGAFFGLT